MNCWSNASIGDQKLFRILSTLYSGNEKLLFILLNPDHPQLQSSSSHIKKCSYELSSGERLLLRIGLDIWDGSGGIHFNELYETLDSQNFQNVILSLAALRGSSKELILF
jgi:hypothetical protein